MHCSKCGSDNREGRKFCTNCGTPLAATCPKCGAPVELNEKFCGECGAAIGASAPHAPSSAQPRPVQLSGAIPATQAIDGERKNVTAVFADIKGSMELMESLDPEEARAIVDPALNLMIDAVRRYDGYIVQSTGDGVFALFGAPVVHEDHPQRALYAALRIQEDIRRYGDRMRAHGQMPLQVRIGANTGEVVVRSLKTGAGHAEYTPIGHSTSLAARLQSLATPGSTVISDSTRRFVEGFFRLKDLGKTAVKGVSEPVQLFEVTGLGPLRTRLQAAARRGLTRFIGRDTEMAQMRRVLELAREGHGQIVAAIGEAGVGKSRLFFEFKAVSETGCLVLDAYSVSHGKASAYLPVIELLREYFKIAAEDDERRRREKIAGKVLILERSLEDTLPYIFSLMGIQDGGDPFAQMDPLVRRRRTQEAIKRILLRESLNQPLVIIFEDLHWIDSETQEFLNCMVEAIANARILLLVNYRLEYRHEWGNRTYYTQLRLDPLDRENTGEMLATLLGSDSELEPLRHLIAERTEGNPFFIEEIVQALFEQRALARNGTVTLIRPLTEVTVPATVRAVLASRIDRLRVDEKDLLQTLAVIGREFTLPLIQRVTDCTEAELEHSLSDLQRGEFIYEQPAFPDAEYAFKHALTQEVAYGSILIERRKLLHEEVGDAIESLFAGRVEECCEALAHHYSRSANTWKAVKYLHLAGQQSMLRSAHTQGIDQFYSSLELLRTLPVSREQVEQELILQTDAGIALGQAQGYSSLETGRAFIRARELCQQLAESARLVQVLWGLWYFYFARAEHQAAREVAEECMGVARRLQDEALLGQASFILGGSQLLMGNLTASQESLQYGIRSYDRQLHSGLAFQYGQDPKVSALCPMALVYWHLGYPDRALEYVKEAQSLARAVSHRYSQAFALGFTGWIHLYRGEPSLADESAQAAISLSTDYGFPLWLGWGRITKGRALAELGKLKEGINLINQGLGVLQSSESELQLTFFLALLAQTQQELGLTQEGITTLHDALRRVGKTGERYYEPELYRLKGEILLKLGDAYTSEARTCFLHAIEVAREQSAKSWELRATASLVRLLEKEGRREEAQAVLAQIYNWFTEGFDTADLTEAKALLEELSE
jgi:predicted ATPase/class 3 adenylate cyclase